MLNNILVRAVLVLWLLSPAPPSWGQLRSQRPFPFETFQLDNGLQVILCDDASLPIVTVVVAYRVGARHVSPGKSGLAYLLERMLMLQGSRNVGRMQHVGTIQRTGGRYNALTERDWTIFYETVPSHHLATVLWLESDRMLSLEINRSGVESWKSTLISELRSRMEANPYLRGYHAFDQLLYPDIAYSHPIQGEENDLSNISVQDVRSFYDTYYRPDNAVIAIAGNLHGSRAEELVRKFFQGLPAGKSKIPELTPGDRSVKTQDVAQSLDSPLATEPAFFLGYRIPPFPSDDYLAFAMIEYILLKGNRGRISERLSDERQLAATLRGGIDKRHDQAAFRFFVSSSNQLKLDQCLRVIQDELDRLKNGRLSEKELERAKNVFKSDYIDSYATTVDKALFLAKAYLSGIPWNELPQELDKYLDVSPSRIQWITNRYLKDSVLVHIKTR